jgi:hypothetical protein
MKTVIIVSKCLSVTKMNKCEEWYHFHFKGVCGGESLKKVILKGRKDFGIQKGSEYLLYVRLISCQGGILKGEILRLKSLSECWDRA